MSSRSREPEALRGPEDIGGRSAAGLLSALAEAPDFSAAAEFLVQEVADAAGSSRGFLLLADSTRDVLEVVASVGFYKALEPSTLSTDDLSNPIVLSTLALAPAEGTEGLGVRGGTPLARWTSLPMPRPRVRGAATVLSITRARELATGADTRFLEPLARWHTSAPGGTLVLEGHFAPDVVETLAELMTLAGPVVARLAALEESRTVAERLSQQRERLTLMVDSLPDPVVITSAGNDIIAQNSRAERLLEVREGDSPGRRRAIELNNLLFTSFLAKTVMMASPGSGPRELNLVDPDEGHDLLFEVLSHPLGTRVGPADAVLSVLRDVTDLRRAANELERQVQRVRLAEIKASSERDRLNLILENVADPILVTDERANIILMNDQAEQLFQPGETLRAWREMQAVQGNDTKFTSFVSEFALLEPDDRRERIRLVRPSDGAELPVEVVSGKIRNERGEPIAIVSVLHDLTSEVEIERLYEALKQLNSELEERVRAATADLAEQNARLQWQSQEVERATRLKSEFLASMSHELRTPINALIGYSALLLDGVLGEVNERQRDALLRGRGAAEHLLALINDILDLAKIEAGKMPLHIEPVSLRSVVNEVAPQIEPMLRKKQLDFAIDIGPDCPTIETDRTKVRQILLNLLSNAVKFTNRGRVDVVARCAPGGVRIEVSDTGIGIREQDLHAIWEDFRQVDQSRTREFGGTGLGLSITHKLLERLGGSASVQSEYGVGSTFSVFLPHRAPVHAYDDASALDVSAR
ncbi:MAG TPA: ATP-binding protein [Gemmatimonadaceae bacterium]|nr:ATP-binding protein [Gemmatimonadaceae bacterium]